MLCEELQNGHSMPKLPATTPGTWKLRVAGERGPSEAAVVVEPLADGYLMVFLPPLTRS